MGRIELDQFELLEERVESLISLVSVLRNEKTALEKEVQIRGGTIDSLAQEIETLKAERDIVRERIAALLQKIEGLA
jgi:FtsZ-binding cell division protein ZapB